MKWQQGLCLLRFIKTEKSVKKGTATGQCCDRLNYEEKCLVKPNPLSCSNANYIQTDNILNTHTKHQLQRWNTCFTLDFMISCTYCDPWHSICPSVCSLWQLPFTIWIKTTVGQRIAWKFLQSKVRDKLWATSIQIHETHWWHGTSARCTCLFEKQGSLAGQGEGRAEISMQSRDSGNTPGDSKQKRRKREKARSRIWTKVKNKEKAAAHQTFAITAS